MSIRYIKNTDFYKIIPLVVLFVVHLSLFWPGFLTPDSSTQYQIALSGQYSDHHPAVMSFVWRYLDRIHSGPGMMLVLHLGLLYGGISLFMDCFKCSSWRFLFLLLPFFPNVLIYSGMIWKDVGFTFAFFFACALLTRTTIEKRPLGIIENILFFSVLFYGTAIKFQAQYCAPVLLIWYTYIIAKFLDLKKYQGAGLGLAIIIAFYSSLAFVNKTLVPVTQENHSWQLVKLYDIAAVSVSEKTPLFPEFNMTSTFSMENLNKTFNHQSVDDMVFPKDAILKRGDNEEQRQELWNTWAKVVISHPIAYAVHRMCNLSYAILSTPGFEHMEKGIQRFIDPGTEIYKATHIAARVFGYIFLAHILYVLLTLGYIILALRSLKLTPAAIPLLAMNMTSFVMLAMLYFFSMAGTPRYTYVVVCLCHASHLFAWNCWQARKYLPELKGRTIH